MSGRAYRRILKERHADIPDDTPLSNSSSSDDEQLVAPVNPFALLMDHDPIISDSDQDRAASPQATAPSKPIKKRKKPKGTAEPPPPLDVNDMSMEDLTKALEEVEHLHAHDPGPSSRPEPQHTTTLSIDAKHLNMESEMSRIFGANVVRQTHNVQPGRRRPGQHRKSQLRKSVLAGNPDESWPAWDPMGLLATRVQVPTWAIHASNSSTAEIEIIVMRHSPTYEKIHQQYLSAVHSGDPSQLQALHMAHPWHPDTLMRLAQLASMTGDGDRVKDIVRRALFAVDRSMALAFVPNPPRVPYVVPTNRIVHLVLLAHISGLVRMPGGRTLLEVAKLALGMDACDPLAMCDVIPALAVRAHECEWLLEWLDGFAGQERPHMKFARGLALWKCNHVDRAVKILTSAANEHPAVASMVGLNVKGDGHGTVTVLPGGFDNPSSGDEVDPSTHLYWHYAQPGWRDPTVSAWVSSIPEIHVGSNSRRDATDPAYHLEAVYRHIVAAEINDMMKWIPHASRDSLSILDPIPPPLIPGTEAYFSDPYKGYVPRGLLGGGRHGPVSLADMSVGDVMQMLRGMPADIAREAMHVLGIVERDGANDRRED